MQRVNGLGGGAAVAGAASCARLARALRAGRPLAAYLAGADGVDRRATPADPASPSVGTRLQAWRACVANGDADAFRRWLLWEGLDERAARAALGDVERRPPGDASGPVDASERAFLAEEARAAEVLVAAYTASDVGAAPATPFDPALPFAPLLAPLATWARRALDVAALDLNGAVADTARVDLERALLTRLTQVCGRALLVRFRTYTVSRPPTLDVLGGERAQSTAYDAFVRATGGAQMLEFFADYPVAARLCVTLATQWVEVTAEFMRRVGEDAGALAAVLGDGAPLGPVVAVRCGASDPHHGGRTVLIPTFAGGLTTVYKPRPVDGEVYFARAVAWLNARRPSLALRTLRVVPRATHGWIEFADPRPCADRTAVARFYRRAGALLCLAHLHGANDFHHENVIAFGEHPVLIDMEALFSHPIAVQDDLPAATMPAPVALRRREFSVLNARFLPTLHETPDGGAVETGGLYASVAADEESPAPGAAAPRPLHLPHLDGRPVAAAAFVDEVAAGYAEAYAAVRGGRREWLGPNGLLADAGPLPVRCILRGTNLYATLQMRGLHPGLLRNGADRGIELDALARPFLKLPERPAVWPLLRAEREALERMDVPHFEARADDTVIVLPDGRRVSGCLTTSATDGAAARIAAMNEADLAFQLEAIRTAFDAVRRDGLRGAPADVRAEARATHLARPGLELSDVACETIPADPGELLEAATCIAYRLEASALRGRDGALTWLSVGYLPDARRHAFGAATYSVLDGYGGIALFAAALARTTGAARHEALARAALHPLRGRLSTFMQAIQLRRNSPVGVGVGIGSAVYALARVGALLGDEDLLRDAARVAELLTPAAAEACRSNDVLSGGAGAVLSLLALHDVGASGTALERAADLGAVLLNRRTADPTTGVRGWATRAGRQERGFAHGVAGVAHALRRLTRAVGDPAYATAADEAWAHERAVAPADLGAARVDDDAAAWSHGAVGVALAHLASGSSDDSHGMAEVTRALDDAVRPADAVDDTVCGGTAAHVELLLEAAARLGRPELGGHARVAAHVMVRRAMRNGRYRTGWPARAVEPGFFLGEAGMGYTLLRAACPGVLPCVPLWA